MLIAKKRLRWILLLFAGLTLGTPLHCQTLGDSVRRNTIKLDLTAYWLYRNAVVFSYERVMKPNQTLGISIGPQQFPSLEGFDSIAVTRDTRGRGWKFGIEYRFYLKKENKYGAPHGVYIGPYASFLNFLNERDITVTQDGVTQNSLMTTKFDVINIGAQLGYQFVVNDRWTFDVVFIGPSISNYRGRISIDGNYTFDPDEVRQEVIDAIIAKFPGFADLITDKTVSSSGKLDNWGYGYRYQFQVGYRFGKKKK